MTLVKQSFLSKIVGRNTYNELKDYAKTIIAIGTCILAFVFLLSFFLHWGIIRILLNLVTGTSLLFVAYIAALVLVLDIEVDVEEPEECFESKLENKPKTTAYKLTIVWGVVLIALGICAIHFSNKYRKHYAFECATFFVDHQAGIYHIHWDDDCKAASENGHIEKMRGYQIDKSYSLCELCREWAEDAEDNSNIYFRR